MCRAPISAFPGKTPQWQLGSVPQALSGTGSGPRLSAYTERKQGTAISCKAISHKQVLPSFFQFPPLQESGKSASTGKAAEVTQERA